jgi:putative pyruvate formate lyase activating enzyme
MDAGAAAEELFPGLSECRLCAQECGADRLSGQRGRCGAAGEMVVSSVCVHRGEEPVLTGSGGVGNVFMSGCSLSCVYCQNWQISRGFEGRAMSVTGLAEELLRLQDLGCPTLGFVTPTHYAPWIVSAVAQASERGLERPLIYNTGSYDSLWLLRKLEGVFDIYLPDFKYWGEAESRKYSGAPGYPSVARAAVREMWRQVGRLETDTSGVAVKGVLVRHLVLPGDLAGTSEIIRFLAREVSPEISVSLLSQYNPVYRAGEFPPLSRRITAAEYTRAMEVLEEEGISSGWVQDPDGSPDSMMPDFDRSDPFSG